MAGAAALGGVLAAAGEYILAAATTAAAFWRVPRQFYQLLWSSEALWTAALAAAVFGVGAAAYYVVASRRGPVRLAKPALLAALVGGWGAAALFAFTKATAPWFPERPAVADLLLSAAAIAAWATVTASSYIVARRLGRRLKVGRPWAVWVLRALAVILLGPVIGADLLALRPAGPREAARPDIYLIIMDAYRADRLGCYGGKRLAPTLDAFAAQATVFRNAYTSSSWTKPAVASLFTSTYPSAHGVVAYSVGLPATTVTLAATLRAHGYATVGISANHNVSRGSGMAAGFDLFDDTATGSIRRAAGPALAAERMLKPLLPRAPFARAFVAPTAGGVAVNKRLRLWQKFFGRRPRFFYIHYMEPHTPNRPRREYINALRPFLNKVKPARAREVAMGRFFFKKIAEAPAFRPDYNDAEVALAKALYDADVRRMDVVISDLLENVIPARAGDAAPVIVFAADHGEEFLEHGRWLHGAGLHREVARIPLLMKVPGCPPATIAAPVNVLDIAPTLASLAGVPAPAAWEGLDLAPYMAAAVEPPARPLLLEGVHVSVPATPKGRGDRIELNGVVADGYFYLKDEGLAREFLYDQRRDPGEEHNLAGARAAASTLAACRAGVAELKGRARAGAVPPVGVPITPARRKTLRAFGYIN